jgi:hypothetical protein
MKVEVCEIRQTIITQTIVLFFVGLLYLNSTSCATLQTIAQLFVGIVLHYFMHVAILRTIVQLFIE